MNRKRKLRGIEPSRVCQDWELKIDLENQHLYLEKVHEIHGFNCHFSKFHEITNFTEKMSYGAGSY
jgi:hypothetical protein